MSPSERTASDLAAQLEDLRRLVLQAGGLLLDMFGKARTVHAKLATEFVTDADRAAEDLLLAGLARLFPGDGVTAEESAPAPGSSGRTWYVDPLDGTTNYAHGYPFFAVSAGCADPQGLALGAVYAPYLDELYLSHRGGGAMLERPRWGGRMELPRLAAVDLEAALLATGFPYVRDAVVDLNTRLLRDFLKAPCHGVRRGGSAAIDLSHVAAGRLDGYWEFSLRPWDTAAGTLIARECGAVVTDLQGAGAEPPWRSILAAAPGLHGRMLAVVRQGMQGQDP